MENQLLAHLSSRLGREHEVIATEGLAYILQASDTCRRSIESLCASLGCNLPAVDVYQAEVSAETLERPDVVGFSVDGDQRIIIEGKFEAGLTDNQPNNYLRRLLQSSPSILIFVVPQHRVGSISRTLSERIATEYEAGASRELPDLSVVQEVNPDIKMLVISWSALLSHLLQEVQRLSQPIASDILQLKGLCERIEGQSFMPFQSEELTSTRMARRHRDLCGIVDTITEDLVTAGMASTKGLKATPQRDGYVRYISFDGDYCSSGGAVCLDYGLWIETGASPLWFAPGKDATNKFRPILKRLASEKGRVYSSKPRSIALSLPVEPNQDRSAIVSQSIELISAIRHLALSSES